MNENVWSHFGQWWAVALWIVVGGVFLLFVPFYKKSQRKPASVYLAFVIALGLEMFGVPLSMYALTWIFGRTLPEGVLWGHTLSTWIGVDGGMTVAYVFYALGILLVVLGWSLIYRKYWSKQTGQGKLVTSGIYRFIRHPQYTGFLMITFAMLCEWATLPMLVMYPILIVLYYRLARREEADMLKEFGPDYEAYCRRTGMFLPRLWKPSAAALAAPVK